MWIDHERALIITLTPFGTIIERERSEAGKRVRLAGGSRSRTAYGPQDVADEPSRDAKYRRKLDRFYDRVAALLEKSEEIYICGPGEAKQEVRRNLDDHPDMASRILEVRAADKMTDKQFVAHVLKYFDSPRPRRRAARR